MRYVLLPLLLLLLLIEQQLSLRPLMRRHVSSCILCRVPSRPTRSSRLYRRCGLLLYIRFALYLSPYGILMHGGVSAVGGHRLYGFFEVLGVHLPTRVSFLNVVEFLFEGRAHFNHFVDFPVDAAFLQDTRIRGASEVEVVVALLLRRGLELERGKHGFICGETLGGRTSTVFN